jgi:hypothetical protein
MCSLSIDTAMAKRLIEVSGLDGAAIIGQPGGSSVILKLGMQEKHLSAERSDKPRVWRSLDSCVEYLKKELRIERFELLDATGHRDIAPVEKGTENASERVDDTAVHDKWFRQQVETAVAEADDPAAEWVTNEEATDSWAKKRAELIKRAEADSKNSDTSDRRFALGARKRPDPSVECARHAQRGLAREDRLPVSARQSDRSAAGGPGLCMG